MDITEDGATVDNSSFLSGNPALRILGNQVRFTNKAGGWIFSNPDHPQASPVIQLTGSQIVFINELGGNIRARNSSYLVLQGSEHADHIENYGILDGKVSLGGGDDYFYGLINLGLNQPTSFDLGDGDDTLVLDVTGSNSLYYTNIEGGAGYDRVAITGYHLYPSGYPSTLTAGQFTGVERIDLGGPNGGATSLKIEALHTTADLYLAPAMSMLVNANFGPNVEVGAIYLDGGDIDIINGASVGDIFGGDSSEWVSLGVGGNTNIPLVVGAVWLGGGSDSFRIAYGQMSAMEVHGGDGADLVRGGNLADSLYGDGGDDVIRGGDGGDLLSGGAGADRLDGGNGGDSLTGGAGGDRFIFSVAPGAANVDSIADFETGLDKIYLSPFAFSNISASTLASYQFHVGSQALTSLTRIIYNSATGALLYDRDGTGNIAAVQFASIAPGLALTSQDFSLAGNSFPTFREAGRPIVRISTGPNGEQADGSSSNGIYAPNGRFVVFQSDAANLVAGDFNGKSDIFLKNLVSGAVFRLSTGPAQEEANGDSFHPVFSPDGLKLLYESDATNIVAGDTPGTRDLFVLDFVTGQTSLVSSSAAGEYGNGDSFVGSFSDDGTQVVFVSAASNLVAGDGNGVYDIFVKDLALGAVTLVASAGAGVAGIGRPDFSSDPTTILFQSEADNLVAGDTNGSADIFLKDMISGTIVRVSTSAAGVQGDGASTGATISPDGTRILFQSAASNLVAGDTNNDVDIFIKDLTTGQVTLVSGFGATEGNGASVGAIFSPDGNKVAFYSLASNLVPGDTNNAFDIFVKDLTDNSIVRISVGATGPEANDSSFMPSFSPDGMSLIFHSAASNLVSGDTNGGAAAYDTFIIDIGSRYTENGDGALIASSLVVADDSDNYMGGFLVAWVSTGAVIGDRITLAEIGGVTVAGTQVSVNGLVVGMIDLSGSTLRIQLNGNADDAAVASVTQAMRFSSTSDAPTTATRTITVQLADGGGDGETHYSASFTHQVAVIEVNDAPVLAASAGITAFTEGADAPGTPVAVDPGLVITDADASRITDATINVTVGGTGDLLGFVNNNAAAFGDIAVFASNGGALQLHSNGGATLAQWQNALRAVTYTNTDDAPVLVDRTVSFILRDSDAADHGILSNYTSRQVSIAPANDTPVNHLPGAQSVDENQVLTFSAANGNAITISDVDATGFAMTVTLDVADGALTLATGYAFQTGNGSNHLVVQGSVEQVNEALEGLTYTPAANANGARAITVTTGDFGQTGSVNLIVNPGAETGTAGGLGSIVPPAGWTIVSGHMSAVLYDPPGGANLVANDPSAGTDYFAGGPGNPGGAPAIVSQTIDLLAHAGEVPSLVDIDAGMVRANLSGWLGGRGTENDNMVFTARFLSAAGQLLGTTQIAGVTAAQRGGVTGMALFESSAALPAGTRSIELILTANHVTGPYIDGYADQLSLTLSKVDVDSIGVTIVPDANDIVFGTTGADTMAAGLGDDTYYVNHVGDLVLEAAGEGNDAVYASLDYALGAGSHVELLAADPSGGTQAINLTGNEFANRIVGNAGNNILAGGLGADQLVGGAGIDTANYAGDAGAVFVNLRSGQGFGNAAQGDTYSGIENLIGSSAGDFLIGDDGVNRIEGSGGDDILLGGLGGDVLVGGSGADTASYEDNWGPVFVNLRSGQGFGNAAQGDSYQGIENLTGGLFNDFFIGDDLVNRIDGGGGDDILLGGLGGDLLIGGTGSNTASYEDNWGAVFVNLSTGQGFNNAAEGDSYTQIQNLQGGLFNDFFIGDANANRLAGGSGNDILIGAGGADTFVFDTALGAGNVDTIADFVTGTDKIALDDAVFAGIGTLGALNPNAFFAGTAAHDADDRIVYDAATGNLYFDADGNGAGAAVLFANLQGHPALIAGDFMVI